MVLIYLMVNELDLSVDEVWQDRILLGIRLYCEFHSVVNLFNVSSNPTKVLEQCGPNINDRLSVHSVQTFLYFFIPSEPHCQNYTP